MRNAHAVADVRTAEQALFARLPDGALMSRAAAGLASVCARLLGQVYGARVVILAGSGDNGGDALFAGGLLAARGAAVTAIAAASRLHEPGAAALRAAGGTIRPARADADQADLDRAGLIIDGLLGIGGRGGLREPAATLAVRTARARAGGAIVVAVDLPSGVDADTGVVAGAAIGADVTVTFGTWKPGLLIDPGAGQAGAVELIDIGLAGLPAPAVAALQAADIAALLPRPGAESDKYRRGVLGLLAGSQRYTGAAVLATGSAIHGGAGMVRLMSAQPALTAALQHWPEAVTTVADPAAAAKSVETAGRVQAWAAGPGMGTDDGAAGLLAAVLASDVPALVDADGITILAGHRELLDRSAPTLITPHAGELARLTGADRAAIEAGRLEHATAAAADLGVTVLLKGSTTVIADPGGTVLVNTTGSAWLATAGSGDVLSGLAGALLAQGLPPLQAAAVAAYLHGVAGRRAADGAPIGAGELITALPGAIRSVTRPLSS
ncbi:MAG TPA: NAD(P)H-hydrate dehydratase [Streptosporangiaceae bacterium]|nr:NAD(P)H-hydrate dehydratase [Streptosporangiaceae bacterium]